MSIYVHLHRCNWFASLVISWNSHTPGMTITNWNQKRGRLASWCPKALGALTPKEKVAGNDKFQCNSMPSDWQDFYTHKVFCFCTSHRKQRRRGSNRKSRTFVVLSLMSDWLPFLRISFWDGWICRIEIRKRHEHQRGRLSDCTLALGEILFTNCSTKLVNAGTTIQLIFWMRFPDYWNQTTSINRPPSTTSQLFAELILMVCKCLRDDLRFQDLQQRELELHKERERSIQQAEAQPMSPCACEWHLHGPRHCGSGVARARTGRLQGDWTIAGWDAKRWQLIYELKSDTVWQSVHTAWNQILDLRIWPVTEMVGSNDRDNG